MMHLVCLAQEKQGTPKAATWPEKKTLARHQMMSQ